MMSQGYFVTGTDTNVGKTWVSIALMRYFIGQGKTVAGMKPVASGCELNRGRLENEDALLIQRHANVPLAYEKVNPYAFAKPVSPHLAADRVIDLNRIKIAFEELKAQSEVIIVEGAGGWLVPLTDQLDIADLAVQLGLPVIMVVAVRLGCINHARLTYQAISRSKLACAGWIAMCVQEQNLMQDEVIETMKAKLDCPLLGVLPHIEHVDFELLAKQLIFPGH